MWTLELPIQRSETEFKLCNVYAKDKCKDCFARFYCSGGCAANSYKFENGSIVDAYDIGCEMQKKRIECAIMIQAALADDNEEKGDKIMKNNRGKGACRSSDCFMCGCSVRLFRI